MKIFLHPFPCIFLLVWLNIGFGIFTGANSLAQEQVSQSDFTLAMRSEEKSQQSLSLQIGDLALWINKIKLSGTIDGEMRWQNHNSFLNKNSAAGSDLYLRLFDFGIEAAVLDWASTLTVLNSEWLGDYQNQGDEKITVDEVHLDLQIPDTPFYIVFGKRTQPFGLFENYLITDPLIQDAYETQKVGLTLGLTGLLESDFSLTPYKGTEQMDHLLQAGLIDTSVIKRIGIQPETVNSFILSGSLTPIKHYLTLFVAYLNEPGVNVRNTTVNLGMNLSAPYHRNLVFASEYMQALSREKYQGLRREFQERAISATATYLFVLRERKYLGSGNYKARKSHIKSHPFETALRYDYFDDDQMTALLQIWSIKDRASIGGRYSFYADGKIFAYFEAEYRQTALRVPASQKSIIAQRYQEIYFRLGIDF